MKNLLTISFILLVGFVSCKKEKIEGKIITNPEFATELKSSPENITIGNNTLMLTSYLWRDFMPVAEENGSPLISVSSLSEIDSLDISNAIELIRQYVINGDEVWIEDYSDKLKPANYILEGVVREGPKWGPNITVDVVCEFEYSGTVYRILAKDQKIDKTE